MTTARPTEAQCATAIIHAARFMGYRVHHSRQARTAHGWRTPIEGDVGFVDLTIAGYGHLLLVELKRKPNRVETEQAKWHDALLAAGADCRVVWVPEGQDAFLADLQRMAGR